MKIEVCIEKKYFIGIVSLIFVIALVGGVFAIGTSTPRIFGHSADEIAVKDGANLRTVQDILGSQPQSGFYPNGVPSGGILAFGGACPDGWTRFAELDGKVPRGVDSAGTGANAPGAIDGADTHTHTWSATYYAVDKGGSPVIYNPLTIDPSSSWPPYLNVVWCKKT
ncbi:MAG: hypothetical protein AABW80_02335 [Nanoarchaeota archaeon]